MAGAVDRAGRRAERCRQAVERHAPTNHRSQTERLSIVVASNLPHVLPMPTSLILVHSLHGLPSNKQSHRPSGMAVARIAADSRISAMCRITLARSVSCISAPPSFQLIKRVSGHAEQVILLIPLTEWISSPPCGVSDSGSST